jgi:hypothetical protein
MRQRRPPKQVHADRVRRALARSAPSEITTAVCEVVPPAITVETIDQS